jgi:transposase
MESMQKRRGEISQAIRKSIIAAFEKGISKHSISRTLNIPRSTVIYICQKWEKSETVKDLARSGRPPKLTDREERSLAMDARHNPLITARELGEAYDVSRTTVRRVLHEHDLISVRQKRSLRRNRDHLRKRLKFAFDHRNTDWDSILFSDEAIFRNIPHRQRVWKVKNTETQSVEVDKRPLQVMVWGFISSHGVGQICFIEGTLDGEKYKQILEEKLIPYIKSDQIFQQDGAPAHRPGTKLLQENNIELLNWPPISPDLSPIENVWSYMKRQISGRAEDEEELKKEILRIWTDIPINYISRLYNSMPRRITLLIRHQGKQIPY